MAIQHLKFSHLACIMTPNTLTSDFIMIEVSSYSGYTHFFYPFQAAINLFFHSITILHRVGYWIPQDPLI
jgi:hypothetical protein